MEIETFRDKLVSEAGMTSMLAGPISKKYAACISEHLLENEEILCAPLRFSKSGLNKGLLLFTENDLFFLYDEDKQHKCRVISLKDVTSYKYSKGAFSSSIELIVDGVIISFEGIDEEVDEILAEQLSHVSEPTKQSKKSTAIRKPKSSSSLPSVVVKTYRGKKSSVTQQYKRDLSVMAKKGYEPTQQIMVEGKWSALQFVLAFLLLFIVVGLFFLLYMIVVKPKDILTVTYTLRHQATESLNNIEEVVDNIKECPMCAETVKQKAKICRYCNYSFEVA